LLGNPLLDISAVVPAEILAKYEVKAGDAILAEDKHMPVYKDLVDNFEVQYIAGGATQNSIRVAQWLSQKEGTTAYIGCIGSDAFGESLKEASAKDGVQGLYMIDAETATGTCAVLVTAEGERSLITDLKAANNYKIDHFKEEPQQEAVKKAEIIYSSGFFLTVCPDAMVEAAKAMNAEAKTFAEVSGWGDITHKEIAEKIQALPKEGKARMAIVTQGSSPTLIATDGVVTEYPVIPCETLVDTNGAGDAWVGGFLFGLVSGKDIPDSVKAANYAANHIIQRSGCTMEGAPTLEF
jgi:adenosine kinase